MVRGCALIDSRLDTAKICSDGRIHVDHAQLPAVFGGEKTFSHGLGPQRKSNWPTRTSDLPLKADIKRTSREVRKVPTTVITRHAQPRRLRTTSLSSSRI